MVAGLDEATYGGVVIDGHEVHGAGRRACDRLSVAVPAAVADGSTTWRWRRRRARRRSAEARELAQSTSSSSASATAPMQLPGALSLGTQQCVSLARALVVDPRFLLLDEPFSQLDSLTRFELQDTLLRVWEASGKIVVMVTHDIDEALYLADRLVLMTDGPEATVGDVLPCPLPVRAAAPPSWPIRGITKRAGTSSTSSSTTPTSRARARCDDVLAKRRA